ncbi:MAG: UDP-N-acetylmuramate dehydrogenase [Candidatus Amulumruptor caecigallinarius]|nr:UDP-N-acetylmuramate dehydrogenase [Candidatus Amulumruptor caecigallinarius]
MIEENKDITHHTTFNIPVKARYYAEYSSEHDLLRIVRSEVFLNNQVFHIGGGSNLLFLSDYDGLVLHSAVRGIRFYKKDSETVYAIAGAGENWCEFVERTINEGLAGLENLAGIPGEVGASAVQNVGAYGVEAGDMIHAVECFDLHTRIVRRFTAEECGFGYRESVFKREARGRYAILRVSFRLRPDEKGRQLEYGPLKSLKDELGHEPTIREVADRVVQVRNSKLPNPKEIGSAGSFFKNPVVNKSFLETVCEETGERIAGHAINDNLVKVSAAWLIDHAGMKGHRVGGASVYDKQPLVIVNDGDATAQDVMRLAEDVRKAVRRKYRINLHPEVNYIDTRIHVTVLGSGTSKGVPEAGCDCSVCTSPYLHDNRMRASVLVRTMGLNLLIDPGPDFREQAIANHIYDIDAVIVTHNHFDHIGGLEDLRPYCGEAPLPIYVREDVEIAIRDRLAYCFSQHPYPGVPAFEMHVIGNNPFFIKGVKIEPIEVLHGKMPIYGYRIGKFAYVTDAKYIEPSEKEKLENLDVLIVNALRDKDHFAHFTLAEALALVEEVRPKTTYLTHLSHEIGRHFDLCRRLPENVQPAYDGLKVTV